MKKCTGPCKQQLPATTDYFNRNRSRKDGLNNICKVCSRARSRQYYQENKEKHKIITGKRRRRFISEHKQRLREILESSKCVDCGIDNILVLEFDHVRGEKNGNVTTMINAGCSWQTALEEIDKCEIVCANCHRIRTYSRMKTYRNN